MDKIISEWITMLEPGEPQTHENMTVFPIPNPTSGGPRYISLSAALREQSIVVTEVDQGGSVPELKVINKGDVPVLLLDGEELAGAKQNRVLNTTILVPKMSELIIPVSCTEEGRWSWSSPEFYESKLIMSQKIRRSKMRHVTVSLAEEQGFASDQSAVWNDIGDLHRKAGTKSASGSMEDSFTGRQKDLDAYLKAFPLRENQSGVLVVLNGKAAGADVITRTEAYADLHDKLIRSYAMDALLDKPNPEPLHTGKWDTFRKAALACRTESYDSAGHGKDHRLSGNNVVGSALTYRGACIHLALFRTDGVAGPVQMSRMSMRREYRID